ncbi:hypothetical protein [Azohydromonas lata]|uniref:Uncharacterized protein n=1 Tax=Azohydromonas lata TaxID=45677 RepID=A0ABU5I883_9BURK|nr:hypothetical protein [Azohydromonas lata]MDZ5455306.1 hypothetical protein [Azohydromonas lata]
MNDRLSQHALDDADSVGAPVGGLLDLTRQQRNLLLLRPLFQLELNKLRLGDGSTTGTAEDALMQGIDTHYLVLSALDLMMEGTTISSGCTADEVLSHLSEVARAMKPQLGRVQRLRVAEAVLAALDNKANGYREFAFEHFDAARGGLRSVRFRLVAYEPDIEDVYRYKPTPEGYLVYLGMLDLAPEDAQELMEKMLDLLVQRGRFDTALEIARRARTLSIEYRQLIRDRLHQACRAPGTVHWSRDMAPGLDKAREHVRQRQSEDQRMEEAVLEALRQAEETRSRANLAQLLKTLQGASLLRSQLVNDISGAGDRFLVAQRSVFRARRPTALPDLEARLLPQLIERPVQALAEAADEALGALHPPGRPVVHDLNALFSLLLEQRAQDVEPEPDDGEIVPFVPPATPFPKETIEAVTHWLQTKFAAGAALRIDELLEMAEDEGLDRTMRRCLVLVLFRSFSDTETPLRHVRSRTLDSALAQFRADVAQGTNLQFTPRGDAA